jgi:phage shock protein C
MFCTKCGVELEERDAYCYQCGNRTGKPRPEGTPGRRLMRSRYDKKIAGVCGGMGQYSDMDPTLVRILWLLLLFGLPPVGLIGYIAAWIIMPQEPEQLSPPVSSQPSAVYPA